MLINFVDFKKAFDSVHRETLWKIMKSYGIPQKIIGIIQNFYDGSRCAVRHGGEMGEWFQVITGVRQGCVLSPLIFALVVEWVMMRVTSVKDTGIRWANGDRLGDLDFADDIALLENSWKGISSCYLAVTKSLSCFCSVAINFYFILFHSISFHFISRS